MNFDSATKGQDKDPAVYQVILHNDDFTPVEFVVNVLERFFYMDRRKAAYIAFEAHNKGRSGCGIYTKEVAETKIWLVDNYATNHGHPLACSMEVV